MHDIVLFWHVKTTKVVRMLSRDAEMLLVSFVDESCAFYDLILVQ